MNAAVLHTLGEIPRFQQFDEPVPSGEEVIVHVRAAALKPIDKQLASGSHYSSSSQSLPSVCGTDGAGYVEGIGRALFVRPRPPYGAMVPAR